MAVNYDRSDCSILAVCDECTWMELVTNINTAHRISLEHLWSVHPCPCHDECTCGNGRAINTAQQRVIRARRVQGQESSGVTRTVS